MTASGAGTGKVRPNHAVKDGDRCTVVAGRHAGKSGIVQDSHISKSGHCSISVCQDDGVRFKTLAKSVVVHGDAES